MQWFDSLESKARRVRHFCIRNTVRRSSVSDGCGHMQEWIVIQEQEQETRRYWSEARFLGKARTEIERPTPILPGTLDSGSTTTRPPALLLLS
jgi:hypothetical protein